MEKSISAKCRLWGIILGISALAALAFVGCASQDASESPSDAGVGGYTITDGSVEVSGNSLIVTLECDPATGAHWNQAIEGNGVEYDSVEHQSDPENPDGDQNTIGYDSFSYTGTGEGTQTITFTYETTDDSTGEAKTVTVETTTNADGQFTQTDTTASDGSHGSTSL